MERVRAQVVRMLARMDSTLQIRWGELRHAQFEADLASIKASGSSGGDLSGMRYSAPGFGPDCLPAGLDGRFPSGEGAFTPCDDCA